MTKSSISICTAFGILSCTEQSARILGGTRVPSERGRLYDPTITISGYCVLGRNVSRRAGVGSDRNLRRSGRPRGRRRATRRKHGTRDFLWRIHPFGDQHRGWPSFVCNLRHGESDRPGRRRSGNSERIVRRPRDRIRRNVRSGQLRLARTQRTELRRLGESAHRGGKHRRLR
jgi:hypothetical protein